MRLVAARSACRAAIVAALLVCPGGMSVSAAALVAAVALAGNSQAQAQAQGGAQGQVLDGALADSPADPVNFEDENTAADTPSAAEVWPAAIGRISYGAPFRPGSAICTGTLILADLVLTAGHCLPEGQARSVRFSPGDAGQFAFEAAVGARIIRPDLPGASRLQRDLALLQLDRPVPGEQAEPLRPRRREKNRLWMVSYSRELPDQRAESLCQIMAQSETVLGISCPVVSGNSGAPLLEAGAQGEWHVVGIVVAQNRSLGRYRAFAVELPDNLSDRAEPVWD